MFQPWYKVEITTTSKNLHSNAKKRARGSLDEPTKCQETQSNKENEHETRKKSKKSPNLTQKNQRTIIQAIQQVAVGDLVASLLGEVDNQLHYHNVQQ